MKLRHCSRLGSGFSLFSICSDVALRHLPDVPPLRLYPSGFHALSLPGGKRLACLGQILVDMSPRQVTRPQLSEHGSPAELNSYSRVLKYLGAVLVIAALMAGVGLRVVGLDRVPPGLYADEARNGYDAYSILLTGRDHHGNFLPLVFQGFNDNHMPLFDGTSNMLVAHTRLPNNDYRWNTISSSGTGELYGNNIRTTWTWHCEAQSPSTVLPGPSPHGNSYAQVYFVTSPLKNNDDRGISLLTPNFHDRGQGGSSVRIIGCKSAGFGSETVRNGSHRPITVARSRA